MSKKSLEHIQAIEDTDEIFDVFIISYLGILGLYRINEKNNLLKLQLKKYRQMLNHISNDSIDVYYMIQFLYEKKYIKLGYALELMEIYQKFRLNNFNLSLEEGNIKEILAKLPNLVYRHLGGKIKFLYKAYINHALTLEELVMKLYNYCLRLGIDNVDFIYLAKKVKRQAGGDNIEQIEDQDGNNTE